MKIAMGELGYHPDRAYHADVNAILWASEGQTDLLCRIGLLQRKPSPLTIGRSPRDARGRPVTFEQIFERRISQLRPRPKRPRR